MRQTIAIVTSPVLVADNDCSITVESFLIVKVNVRGQPNFFLVRRNIISWVESSG